MIQIPNYTVMRLDRSSGNIKNSDNRLKRGGGLLLYIHESVNSYKQTTVLRSHII